MSARRAGGAWLAAMLPAFTVLSAVAVHASRAAAEVRVSLAGSVPGWALPAHRDASVPAGRLIDLAVYMSWRHPRDVAELATEVSDPHSPRYGHYLDARRFRERFAPDQADVDAVAAWLRGEGLRVTAIPANRHYVAAQGTAARVEAAFGTGLAGYRVGGRVLRAPTATPTMPALHGVAAVSGLDEARASMHTDHVSTDAPPPAGFANAPPCSAYWGEKLATGVPPAYGAVRPYVPCGYGVDALRSVYGLDHAARRGLDGRGQTVAVTGAYSSATIREDVDRQSHTEGIPPFAGGQFREVQASGGRSGDDPTCDVPGWYGEESLDVEAVHMLAPRANVVYVSARDCSNQALDEAITTVVDRQLAQVVTNSWGSSEDTDSAELGALADTFLQAAIEGIGVICASGDTGDQVAKTGTRQVDFPASATWVTAVGGTSLGIGAHGERVFETGWGVDRAAMTNGAWETLPGSFLYGAGGGTSRVFAEPGYQQGVVPASLARAHGHHSARVLPDLAMDGDPNTGIVIGVTQRFPDGVRYGEYRIGGTSLAAPLVAAIELLADEEAGMHHGFLNPALYRLHGTKAFRDVDAVAGRLAAVRVDYANRLDATGGLVTTLRTLGETGTLHTTPGYDDVTGLGTPRGAALLEALDR